MAVQGSACELHKYIPTHAAAGMSPQCSSLCVCVCVCVCVCEKHRHQTVYGHSKYGNCDKGTEGEERDRVLNLLQAGDLTSEHMVGSLPGSVSGSLRNPVSLASHPPSAGKG